MAGAVSFLISILLLTSPSVWPAFQDPGFGVRPEGMGGAFTAVADDANAVLYNPAGTKLTQRELILSYAKPLAGLGDEVDLDLFHAAYGSSIRNAGGVGLAWSGMRSPHLRENAFILNGSLSSNAFSRYRGGEIVLGANVKRMSRSYRLDRKAANDPVFASENEKNLFSFDLGIWARPFPESFPNASLGFVLKNLNEPDAGLRSREAVPMETVAGIAWRRDALLFSFDFSRRDRKDEYRGGAEVRFLEGRIGVRAGANSSNGSVGLSCRNPFGSSLIGLDYAFIMPFFVKESAGTHRAALSIRR